MPNNQRFISPLDSVVSTPVSATAGAVRKSVAIFPTVSIRTGTGLISVVPIGGGYSGLVDRTVDVRIKSSSVGSVRTTAPVRDTVGTGDIIAGTPWADATTKLVGDLLHGTTRTPAVRASLVTGPTGGTQPVWTVLVALGDTLVDGGVTWTLVDPNTFADLTAPKERTTFTVIDIGTVTTQALLDLGPAQLVSIPIGVLGNNAAVDVDTSGLIVDTIAPRGILLETFTTTEEFKIGDQWDSIWGASALVDGQVPDTAPRVSFGIDPAVYRLYKEFVGGAWNYFTTPRLVRDAPAGTPVYNVTGNRTITLTDTVIADEAYTSIKTVYDLLIKLVDVLGPSAISGVNTVINNDKAPGGMGVVEWPIVTKPFALPSVATGEFTPQLRDVSVTLTALTQTVLFECIENKVPGLEKWKVVDIKGRRATDAITTIPYVTEDYTGTIPQVLPNTGPLPTGSLTLTTRFQNKNQTLLLEGFIGPNIKPEGYTFSWVLRPDNECSVDGSRAPGTFDGDCLGIQQPESTIVPSTDARLLEGQRKIGDAWKLSAVSNTIQNADKELRSDSFDLDFIEAMLTVLHSTLKTLFDSGTPDQPVWTTTATKAKNAWIEPVTKTGYIWRANNAGTTGPGPTPDLTSTVVGATQTDNGITWENIGKTPYEEWLDMLANAQVIITALDTIDQTPEVTTALPFPYSTTVVLGVEYVLRGTTILPALLVRVVQGGTTGAFAGVLPNRAIGAIWDGNTSSLTDQPLFITLAEVAPDSSTGIDMTDFNAVAVVGDPTVFITRYHAWATKILTLAHLPPFDGAGVELLTGGACYTDPGHVGFFQDTDGRLLPISVGERYYSVQLITDSDGNESVQPTFEFHGVLFVGCVENLVEGDSITIKPDGLSGNVTIQIGNTIALGIVNAGPAAFTGGVNGDNKTTMSVSGSVTGPMPNHTFITGVETAYDPPGLPTVHPTFYQGPTPWALRDIVYIDATGGRMDYRTDGGGYGAEVDIPEGTLDISDGLGLVFTPGPAPSWIKDDSASFLIRQPYGPSVMLVPDSDFRAQWQSAGDVWVFDLGSPQTIGSFLIGQHTLPQGATILLEGGPDGVSWPWSHSAPWSEGPINVYFQEETATYLRLTVALATAGGIGWFWAGAAFVTAFRSNANLTDTLQTEGEYLGEGQGAVLKWNDWLREADYKKLLVILKHSKRNNNQVFAYTPNVNYPDETRLVTVRSSGEFIAGEVHNFQGSSRSAGTSMRLLSMDLKLEAEIDREIT